jgi:hypothetical protein
VHKEFNLANDILLATLIQAGLGLTLVDFQLDAENPYLFIYNIFIKIQGIKNNTNFRQITGIQEKLDTTCK